MPAIYYATFASDVLCLAAWSTLLWKLRPALARVHLGMGDVLDGTCVPVAYFGCLIIAYTILGLYVWPPLLLGPTEIVARIALRIAGIGIARITWQTLCILRSRNTHAG